MINMYLVSVLCYSTHVYYDFSIARFKRLLKYIYSGSTVYIFFIAIQMKTISQTLIR